MSQREVELMEFVQDIRGVIRNEDLNLDEASEEELRNFLGIEPMNRVSRLHLSMIGAYASELYRRQGMRAVNANPDKARDTSDFSGNPDPIHVDARSGGAVLRPGNNS